MPFRKYTLIALMLVICQLLPAQEAPDLPDAQNNLFTYGFNLKTNYDDREGGAGGAGVIASIQPQIGLQMMRRRWQSTIGYMSGFTYSTKPRSSYDPISQALGLRLTNRLSKRLTLTLQNNFSITSNPFDTIEASAGLQPSHPLNEPNSTLPAGSLSRLMEHATATVGYALGPRSQMGMRANYMYLDYRDTDGASSPLSRRSVTESATFFYNRQVGRRSTMGFSYIFQKLDFGRGRVKTDSHNLVYQWSMAFSPAVELSAFAGPAYTDTRSVLSFPPGLTLREARISAVGGATLAWNNTRNGVAASAVHQISDGGGSGGAVTLDSFKLEVNRQLSKLSTVRGFVDYNRNHLLLALAGTSSSFDYLSAGAEISRKLTSHMSIGLTYMRVQGEQRTTESSRTGNRIGIRLSYASQIPLGR